MEIEKRTPGSILDERSRLLATIIDAYLQSPEEILVHHVGDGEIGYFHPNWPRGYSPNISHVKALATADQIDLTLMPKNDWAINVPNRTLQAFESQDTQAVGAEAGEDRVEKLMGGHTINQFIYGGSHNIANASTDFRQELNVGPSAEDIATLITSLQSLGIPEAEMASLRQRLQGETEPRKAVMQWFFGLSTDIVSGAFGSLAATNYGTIAGMVTAFGSGILG